MKYLKSPVCSLIMYLYVLKKFIYISRTVVSFFAKSIRNNHNSDIKILIGKIESSYKTHVTGESRIIAAPYANIPA